MKKILICLLLSAPAALWAAVEYSIVNIDTLGLSSRPDCDGTAAYGVNPLGQVVVRAGLFVDAVFVYTDGRGLEPLGPAGTGGLIPYGINDSGQVVADGFRQLFRYEPSQGWQAFDAPGDGTGVNRGINNAGQMIGISTNDVAYRYTDGLGFQFLGSLGGGPSYAAAINKDGWVTGTADGSIFLYRDDLGMNYLGPGSGASINDEGIVAGYDPSVGVVLCTLGVTFPLGFDAIPTAINNWDQIVGCFVLPMYEFHAFVWSQADGVRDLNDLISPGSGWVLHSAYDINDLGQIVGYGTYQSNTVAFRLDPLPRLSIRAEGTNVVVSWKPAWPDAVLQATDSLGSTNWQRVPTGGTNVVRLPATAPARFFRVIRP